MQYSEKSAGGPKGGLARMGSAGQIAKEVYPGVKSDTRIAAVWNILFVSERMHEQIAYEIAKTMFERHALAAVHKEAEEIAPSNQSRRLSPIPFHPGTVRYLRERSMNPNRGAGPFPAMGKLDAQHLVEQEEDAAARIQGVSGRLLALLAAPIRTGPRCSRGSTLCLHL